MDRQTVGPGLHWQLQGTDKAFQFLSSLPHSSASAVLLQSPQTSPQTHLICSSHAAQSSYSQLTQRRKINEKLIPLIHCKRSPPFNQISCGQTSPDEQNNKFNLRGPSCNTVQGVHLCVDSSWQRDKGRDKTRVVLLSNAPLAHIRSLTTFVLLSFVAWRKTEWAMRWSAHPWLIN